MYKKKSKYLYALFAFMLIALICIPYGLQTRPQAASKPGTVKLTKISATDYNKINIKWKKTSGATNYIVYYRKSGVSKWTKIKTLDNTKSSYTHTSSSKYPIIVGQKYQYTVKAYNKSTKKSGSYNTKGLTANTIPQIVVLGNITTNSANTHVSISWKKANGCSDYIVYRKTGNSQWKYLVTLPSSRLSFTDSDPVLGTTSYYTVKSYYRVTKSTGKYNTAGLSIYIPKVTDITPTSTPEPEQPSYTEEQFAEEVFRLTNIERNKLGIASLKHHEKLQQAAMQRAKEISIKFSHTRPNGTDSSTILGEYGVACSHGENIAAGFTDPDDVVNAWMKSDGHRAALLNSVATHVGIGVYIKADGTYCCVQDFSSDPDKIEKITIDANGGYFPTLNNVTKYEISFPYGATLIYNRDLPVPVKNGFSFDCWEDEYGCRYSGIKRLSVEINLHAIWKK